MAVGLVLVLIGIWFLIRTVRGKLGFTITRKEGFAF